MPASGCGWDAIISMVAIRVLVYLDLFLKPRCLCQAADVVGAHPGQGCFSCRSRMLCAMPRPTVAQLGETLDPDVNRAWWLLVSPQSRVVFVCAPHSVEPWLRQLVICNELSSTDAMGVSLSLDPALARVSGQTARRVYENGPTIASLGLANPSSLRPVSG